MNRSSFFITNFPGSRELIYVYIYFNYYYLHEAGAISSRVFDDLTKANLDSVRASRNLLIFLFA